MKFLTDKNRPLEQPFKIPWVASVILLANARKPDFGAEVVSKLGGVLQTHIDQGNWREVKLYLRFLSCLQGMFEGDGVFAFLRELFNRAVDLQTRVSDDSLGLELVKIIILTIPYTMASSANDMEKLASTLLEETSVLTTVAHPLEVLIDPHPSLEANGTTSSSSALALLQGHMEQEAQNGWPLASLPRPWRPTEKAAADEEHPLSEAQKLAFPAINLPETIPFGPQPVYPEVYFSVYDNQGGPATVPPPSDTSSILLRDAINDTINVLHVNRYLAARSLIDVDLYFAPRTFVHRGTSFDKLPSVDTEGQMQWKPEDVVVDACFANLFQLPAPEQKLVYYHSVLTEACRLQPSAVAPSLGRAIRYLYRNVEKMDMELYNRFLEWFSHHLSNFGFTWKWTEWTGDLELSELTPKKAFILDSLEKEIRLSFAARIRGTLPPEYAPLIGKEKEIDAPMPKYEKEGVQFGDKAKEIVQLIRKRAPVEEFEPLLEAVESDAKASGSSDAQAKATTLDVLTTSIAWVGSKSLSHVLAIVERSKSLLLQLTSTDIALQGQIISSFVEYWQHQTGTAVTIALKLVNYQVLTPEGVINWAFSAGVDGGRSLAKVYLWEVVVGVVAKMQAKVRAVVKVARTPGLDDEKRIELRGVVEREVVTFNTLLAQIKTGLATVQSGAASSNSTGVVTTEEEEALIKVWAAKWALAIDRLEKVLALYVREEMAKPIPEPEVKPEAMEEVKIEDEGMNGGGAGEGNGDANGMADDLDIADV